MQTIFSDHNEVKLENFPVMKETGKFTNMWALKYFFKKKKKEKSQGKLQNSLI